MVKNPPEGYRTITPMFVVNDATGFISFVEQGLGGTLEGEPMKTPDGMIMHAAMKIGDSMLMLAQAMEGMPANGGMLFLYVDDPDALYERAVAAGATPIQPPRDQPWGDRAAAVKDSNGLPWWFAKHIEDLTMEEIGRRFAAEMSGRKDQSGQ
jgi:PhnB protein